MLVFATQPKPQFKTVLISDLLNESLKLLSPMIETSLVEVALKGEARAITVLADDELLGQIFLNIIINALQAMKEQKGGKLTIDVNVSRNSAVEISFTDTGVGISKSTAERIFDPFFTTKAKGAGLGLSIVSNLMKAHGGVIEVDGNVGKGATIKLKFPLYVEKEMLVGQVVNS
jgi:signal transduction histidine kinase